MPDSYRMKSSLIPFILIALEPIGQGMDLNLRLGYDVATNGYEPEIMSDSQPVLQKGSEIIVSLTNK